MNVTPKFQNRLVGAVVLVSLGVIVLPDVFDGEKRHNQETIEAIPLKNQVDESLITVEVKEPVSVDDVVLPKAVINGIATDDKPGTISQETIQQKKQREVAKAEIDSAAPKQAFKDSAWIIRLGTFRNHQNANALVRKLQTQGYPAQIKPNNLKTGDLARVEVGPEISQQKIDAMRVELEKITGLKGQVIKFNPLTL